MSSDTFKLKLKLTAPLVQRHDEGKSHQGGNDSERIRIAPMDADENKSLLIGARGGAALKGLLSTAPNPEEAIRAFQSAHGLSFKTTAEQHGATQANGSSERVQRFTPAEQLLDLLHVSRSGVYQSLLSKLMDEMLLRIQELAQEELQRLLEATFPYIEFRELRKIPIAILSRQEDTPEAYLRELTENRRILSELPVHVRRKIMHVDKLELQYFVEQCTQEYIEEKLDWYLKHGGGVAATSSISSRPSGNGSASSVSDNGNDLWNVSSHMPSPSTRNHTQNAPEERRRQSAALSALSEMIGDSESLYLTTIEILKEYVVTANIPGSTNTNAKDYVDYVPLLGALRCDLANLQRDKTTPLLRTDPLHKFIWFLDRAVKNQNTLDLSQLHELLMVIKRLRTGDVPLNKKFKKKSEIQEEEDNFEIVLGPPPVDQLLIVLDKIAKVDARMIFAEPVPDDVPNYRDIIKEPMDLSTMRKKAKKGKYKTLEMFTEDFNLMIKNCMTFNPDTTVFYKEGKRVGKRGLEIIEKNAITLRGEPQRIRAKKRKKSGPAEAMTMLTSSGVTTLKDFGDVDQTGMVPEGICEETLADIAMILCDPHVKQMLCDALLKTLVSCLQKRELPTDNLVCRGLVQLLQIGNPASVRRMLRKRDFVLRAPQVVTMRVMLPLLIRAMSTYRIGLGTHPMQASREPKSLKQDLSDSVLWENMLRASSAIRSITKAFVLQCFKDHHVELAAYLLELLTLVEDDLLFRDRIFLHSLGEIVLNDAKSHTSSLSSNDSDFGQSSNGNSGSLESMTHSLIWKTVVDRFLVHSVETRTIAAKQSVGSAVQYYDPEEGDEVESFTDNGDTAKHLVVKSYPLPILHEKAIMVIATALNNASKANSGACDSITNMYLRKMLGTTRLSCSSRNDFEALWNSQSFQQCRLYYEPLLSRCPQLRDDIFSDHFESLGEVKTDEKAESKADAVNDEAADGGAAESHEDDPEREAGEVEEDAMMKDEP